MPTFEFPLVAWWGLPLAAAPLVIHLVTLLRRKRVPFAALEFLLESRRRSRARVLLRDWLLLAVRTAAVVGIVLALARPRWDGRGGPFGAGSTFHLVILDDSYSMGDRAGGGGIAEATAFDRGRRVAERIATDLADAGLGGELAAIRSSRCAPDAGGQPDYDLPRQPVGPAVARLVRDGLTAAAPSARATGPGPALAMAADLLASGSAGPAVLWLLSDFRAKDWASCADATAALERLAAAGVGLRFVDCAADVDPGAGNLTVESLRIVGGVPAAGVLVPFEVTVRNDGAAPARDVQVSVREDGGERPGVGIPEIPPGGTATAGFEVRFPSAGDHVVAAGLAGDRLPADDTRAVVVAVREAADVLIVDGDPRGSGRAGDAFFLAAALAPGPGAATGLRPRVEPPRALAELELAAFDSIWLLDVERLDAAEVSALEAFARAGGGVAFFVGPRTDPAECNRRLHRGGAGLFPVALGEPTELPAVADGAARRPDIRVDDHPVVAVLSGQRNPLLDAVRIERFMAVDEGAGPAARRLLSLRTGAPLAVERSYGAGLVVAVLTTAAPLWNNWARGNPSWVVTMLELESHLARSRRQARSVEVDAAVTVRLADAAAGQEVDFTVPPAGAVVRVAAAPDGAGDIVATLPRAAAPGIVVARWRGGSGAGRERLCAVNVDPTEGRLERIDRDGLSRALGGLAFTFDRGESPTPLAPAPAGTGWTRPLAVGLLILLLAEQLLAERASDHPAVRPGRGRPAPA